MKAYSKNDLVYKNGLLLTSDGDVVAVDNAIVDMANELETRLQKANYIMAQPEAVAAPTLDGFTRKSEIQITPFTCETPLMDKRVEEAKKLMDEIDDVAMTNTLNDQLRNYSDLVIFIKEDMVIDAERETPHRFDVPTMGNPLEWTEDDLFKFIAITNGCSVVGGEEDVQSE